MAIAYDSTGVGESIYPTNPADIVLDITSAATDAWVYACLVNAHASGNNFGTNPSGWVTVVNRVAVPASLGNIRVVRHKKAAEETTFTFGFASQTDTYARWVSYTGLHATAPDEGSVLNALSSGTSSATTAATPTAADRWALVFNVNTSTAGGTGSMTYTPDGATTERGDSNNSPGTAYNTVIEHSDSNAVVTQASHTYTATCNKTIAEGAAIIVYLIPAAGGGASPTALATLARKVTLAAVDRASNW